MWNVCLLRVFAIAIWRTSVYPAWSAGKGKYNHTKCYFYSDMSPYVQKIVIDNTLR